MPRSRLITLMVGAALALLSSCARVDPTQEQPFKPLRWAVYYDNTIAAEHFNDYDLLIFDREHYPPFAKIKEKTTILAYISIGELHGHSEAKEALKEKDLLIDENPTWGSYVVDITAPFWHEKILAKVADAKAKGFDGVMLDTLDSPLHWAESQSEEKRQEIEDAAVALVATIRETHPDLRLALNRGFRLLPRLVPHIDYAIAESIYSKTDVSSGQFELFPTTTYAELVDGLTLAKTASPDLQILTLDYWAMDDVEGVLKIYAAQRANGFSPYVTTPDLRQLTHEPRSDAAEVNP
jgi:uncharacterized protein (TIGR01370 family)